MPTAGPYPELDKFSGPEVAAYKMVNIPLSLLENDVDICNLTL
jgi:hypothetical protein